MEKDNIQILNLFSVEALVKNLEDRGLIVKILKPNSFEGIAEQLSKK